VLKIGLTGGIACGKSLVRMRLEERGFPTLDADEVVHRLLGPGSEATREIRARFGETVIGPDGAVDRKALGAIVFSDSRERDKLNEIVHPRVWAEIARFFGEAATAGARLAVVDAALMVETGSYETYDRLIVVHCRPEQQVERLMKRDGLSREQAEKRIAAQMPIEEKRGYGDFLVDTSGSLSETEERIEGLVEELERLV
jgi:dephospho-CoA kinase